MNVTYIYYDHLDDQLSFEWRCGLPARALVRTGRNHANMLSVKEFAQDTEDANTMCSQSDVLIIHRHLLGTVLGAVDKWTARGKKVLVDQDIAVHLLSEGMADYHFWQKGKVKEKDHYVVLGMQPGDPLPVEQFLWGLRLVHGALLPSERMADDLNELTDPVFLPNMLEIERYRNQTSLSHEGILIGLGGDGNLFPGLLESGVLEALKTVCEKRPQVRIAVMGGDDRVYERLAISRKQKILWPTFSFEEWPHYLSTLDIGLSPVAGGFDQRRGWERVLEYMAMKIPWIASEGPVYRSLSPYGWIVHNTVESWEKIILEMVDHLEDYRAEAAGEPYLFALSQDIDENINKILMAYGH